MLTVARTYRHELNSSSLQAGEPQLAARDLALRFGTVQALGSVGTVVHQGDIHAVIGPNGAGKTSLLNCISGLYQPQSGSLQLRNDGDLRDLTRAGPSQIAHWGVARTFQNIALFRHMTVLDNLMLGRHVHMSHNLIAACAFIGPARRQEVAHRKLVEEVIDFLKLQAVRREEVGRLPYGLQKRIELGRALCMQPAILLLDEPMAGMNAEERESMARYILDVNELAGVTTVLIEHDMGVVMDISDRVTVLDFGTVIADGPPKTVSEDPRVVEAYLGEGR